MDTVTRDPANETNGTNAIISFERDGVKIDIVFSSINGSLLNYDCWAMVGDVKHRRLVNVQRDERDWPTLAKDLLDELLIALRWQDERIAD